MATRRNASAATVRAFLIEKGETVGTRGKFSQEHIDMFNKGNKSEKFEYGAHKPSRRVTVVVEGENGRKRPLTKNVSLPEVRAAAIEAGYPLGQRGRVHTEVINAYVAGTLPALVAGLSATE